MESLVEAVLELLYLLEDEVLGCCGGKGAKIIHPIFSTRKVAFNLHKSEPHCYRFLNPDPNSEPYLRGSGSRSSSIVPVPIKYHRILPELFSPFSSLHTGDGKYLRYGNKFDFEICYVGNWRTGTFFPGPLNQMLVLNRTRIRTYPKNHTNPYLLRIRNTDSNTKKRLQDARTETRTFNLSATRISKIPTEQVQKPVLRRYRYQTISNISMVEGSVSPCLTERAACRRPSGRGCSLWPRGRRPDSNLNIEHATTNWLNKLPYGT